MKQYLRFKNGKVEQVSSPENPKVKPSFWKKFKNVISGDKSTIILAEQNQEASKLHCFTQNPYFMAIISVVLYLTFFGIFAGLLSLNPQGEASPANLNASIVTKAEEKAAVLSFIDKTETIFKAMVTLSNEELQAMAEYINGQKDKATTLSLLKRTREAKNSLLELYDKLAPSQTCLQFYQLGEKRLKIALRFNKLLTFSLNNNDSSRTIIATLKAYVEEEKKLSASCLTEIQKALNALNIENKIENGILFIKN